MFQVTFFFLTFHASKSLGGDLHDVCLLPPLRANDPILTLRIFLKNGLVKNHLRRSPFLGGNMFSYFLPNLFSHSVNG